MSKETQLWITTINGWKKWDGNEWHIVECLLYSNQKNHVWGGVKLRMGRRTDEWRKNCSEEMSFFSHDWPSILDRKITNNKIVRVDLWTNWKWTIEPSVMGEFDCIYTLKTPIQSAEIDFIDFDTLHDLLIWHHKQEVRFAGVVYWNKSSEFMFVFWFTLNFLY